MIIYLDERKECICCGSEDIGVTITRGRVWKNNLVAREMDKIMTVPEDITEIYFCLGCYKNFDLSNLELAKRAQKRMGWV